LWTEKRRRAAGLSISHQKSINLKDVSRREARMKKRFASLVFVLLMLGLCLPAFTQSTGTVKGVCRDSNGTPIPDAVVIYVNLQNGQKFTLKTNKKGEYFSLGVVAGKYNVTLYQNADDAKANKELDHVYNFIVTRDENILDLDLKKDAEAAAKSVGLTPEQLKQRQAEAEKIQKENGTIKSLNEKLVAANTAMKAGDYETAVSTLNEATQMDATHDILWAQLGDANRGSAPKQTDPAEKKARLLAAVDDYQKAIDLKQKAMETKKGPDDAKQLAGYYNNMADADYKAGKVDDAVKAYTQALQINPEGASAYYYNIGAVLTNAGRIDDAIAAFDKCIAADPNKAEAYYQKGVNLIGKATLQGDKMVAPPGTAEAFNKYLELAPTGPYADVAKQMLASIGAPVETGFGKKKAPPKKSN
jgi:tetratricopeptide (TPR) repeat protein